MRRTAYNVAEVSAKMIPRYGLIVIFSFLLSKFSHKIKTKFANAKLVRDDIRV